MRYDVVRTSLDKTLSCELSTNNPVSTEAKHAVWPTAETSWHTTEFTNIMINNG